MNKLTITPKSLHGSVLVPPSKSIAHRAIICAALSDSTSVIKNISFSDDITATINAVKLAGAEISITNDTLYIKGIQTAKAAPDEAFDCNESGSTLRFLVPIMATLFPKASFTGKGRLGKRPLDVYYRIFDTQNITYSVCEEPFSLSINGKLQGGSIEVPGDISSQFITGLLLALPLSETDSEIIVTEALESKGYIDLTLDVMKAFGIEIVNEDYRRFLIKGNQKYSSCDYTVEGDYSQAAFFEVANFIGNDIKINGMNPFSLQGDKQILDIVSSLKSASEDELIVIDGSQCPDIMPIAAVAASLRRGETHLVNIGRLRLKESDRLSAIAEELTKLGGKIKVVENSLIINGADSFNGADVDSHNDHRIAMMLAIASTRSSGRVTISGYESVSKSYPDFFEVFRSLGGVCCE